MIDAMYRGDLWSADGVLRLEVEDIAVEEQADVESVVLPEMTLERMVIPFGINPLEEMIVEEVLVGSIEQREDTIRIYQSVSRLVSYSTFMSSYAQHAITPIEYAPEQASFHRSLTETASYVLPLVFFSSAYRDMRREREPYQKEEGRKDLPIETYSPVLLFTQNVPTSQTELYAMPQQVPSFSIESRLQRAREVLPIEILTTIHLETVPHLQEEISQMNYQFMQGRDHLDIVEVRPANLIVEPVMVQPMLKPQIYVELPVRTLQFERPFGNKASYSEASLDTPSTNSIVHTIPELIEQKHVSERSPKLSNLSADYHSDTKTLEHSIEKPETTQHIEADCPKESGCNMSGVYLEKARTYRSLHQESELESRVEQKSLSPWVRNGEVQEGFALAERIEIGENIIGVYEAIRKYSQNTLEFRTQTYIDTDTGLLRMGTYLESIAEFQEHAKQFGGKDAFGANLKGIIIFVNEVEPGEGTIPLDRLILQKGDIVKILYKTDQATYEPLKQAA